MIAYLETAWSWWAGVAPYVGAFAALAVGGVFGFWIVIGWMANAAVKEEDRAILERAQKAQAKPQGEGKVWSI